jgi:hypothetical protein
MASEKPTGAAKLRFHFIKSNYFRVVDLDGIFGGIGPRGDINMNFFAERGPIPKAITHSIDMDTGLLGDELIEERDAKDGLIREVEFSASIDMSTAKSLISWLQEKVDILEAQGEDGN